MATYKTLNDLVEQEDDQSQNTQTGEAGSTSQKQTTASSTTAGKTQSGTTASGGTSSNTAQSSTEPESTTQQSNLVSQAQALLQQQIANKPGAFQSQYQNQLQEMADQIMNRDKFSYDVNADALYQQMVEQYANQGKLAMMDTMGQAQAMTGGYGNSYAQAAGQQTYQGYLQQAAEMLPDYYQMARDQYNQEGQDLYNQYAMLLGQDETDYGRYQDALNNYYTELDRLQGVYDQERAFQYQQGRDQMADQQWQAELAEEQRQFNYIHGIKDPATAAADKQKEQDQALWWDWWFNGGGKEASENGGVIPADVSEAAGSGFNGSTYNEAAAYLKTNGQSASGLMTQSEWQRHKNNNDSADGEHEASSYQEYLDAYVYGKTK